MKSAICCIVKNEQRYIREWVDWHLCLGVDHVYVYEDYGSGSHVEELAELISEGKVSVIPLGTSSLQVENIKGSGRQYRLYCKFLERARRDGSYDWVFFIDVDEFVQLDDGLTLQDVFERYSEQPAVYMSWRSMTANGHIARPEGGVVENYTSWTFAQPDVSKKWQFKSLVNVGLCEGLTTLHEAIGGTLPDGNGWSGGPCWDTIWLNHYYTKSWEDYCERMQRRGNFSNNYRTYDQFFVINTDLLPLRRRLLKEVQGKPLASTTWVSRQYKKIAGGNEAIIRELERGRLRQCRNIRDGGNGE